MTIVSPFERAVTELFQQRFGTLFRYLDRLTGDPDLAADVAQEAFVRLYQRGDIPDDPQAWLATVATNLVRDTHRRGSRRADLLVRHADVTRPDPWPTDASEHLLAEEARTSVRRALETLPERDRQLLLLRHEGFSYKELAQFCGIAESSVGTLLLRATQAFRAAYTQLTNVSHNSSD